MKSFSGFLFHYCLLPLTCLIFSASFAAKSFNTPSPTPLRKTVALTDYETPTDDFETFTYTQTLDHFSYRPESYTTFQQRYVINSKYWGGANASANATAPIFAYLGERRAIDQDVTQIGFLTDNAPQFQALLVYIEHRYYGKSIPYNLNEESDWTDANNIGYLSSAQALADYAAILLEVKTKYNADNSPVVVIGGSYGGMLASWFRLKYPHLTVGALASSAPILYFDNLTPQDDFYNVVAKNFRETSESCYEIIRQSWNEIDAFASQPFGLSTLSQMFQTCSQLEDSSVLEDYLKSMYAEAAQFDQPPANPVLSRVCGAIVEEVGFGNDVLQGIFAGVVAYEGTLDCYVNPPPTNESVARKWQSCSEIVIPIGITSNGMFPPDPFDIDSYSEECMNSFGVQPRPHWITTYYGGQDIKLTLQRFGSNIIFTNGLRDPYSSGGVLQNISDTVVALPVEQASQGFDLLQAKESDPDWLEQHRRAVADMFERWMHEYNSDQGSHKN